MLFSQKMSAGKKWKRWRRKLYSKIPLSCQEFSVELFEMLIVKLLFVLVEKGSVLFKEESLVYQEVTLTARGAAQNA